MPNDQLVPPSFLFRFSVPCRHHGRLWSDEGVSLGDAYRLPCFGELDDGRVFAELRGAWSNGGLSFTLEVSGKRQLPWCRDSRAEDSDGLHLWIDTRDTHSIHRASRFCHRFIVMPRGSGTRLDQPVALWRPINRARENPKAIPRGTLPTRSQKRADGYRLEVHLPAHVLTGYAPADHPRLGFTYAVADRELGWQTFSVGPNLPFQEDPSLWGTLELAE